MRPTTSTSPSDPDCCAVSVCATRTASGRLGSFLDQLADAVGTLSALGLPVFDTSQIHSQTLFLTAGDRVEEAHALNEAAVASSTAVSDSQVVERTLLGATARQTNRYH